MQTTSKGLTKRLAFVVAISASAILVGPSPAHAQPTHCVQADYYYFGQSFCAGGTGEHRVSVECYGSPNYWVSTPWAPVGVAKRAYCKSGDTTTGKVLAGKRG